MVILTDTREQLPLAFRGIVVKRTTLNVGDYTTAKLKGVFHIERKSLADLYQTLTHGNKRFKYELFRAAYDRITICIYVEGTREAFVAKLFPKGNERKFSSSGLDKLVKTFESKYHLQFYWHSNRAACSAAVVKRLQYEEYTLAGARRMASNL